jgi:predicted nucleotidyltransferase
MRDTSGLEKRIYNVKNDSQIDIENKIKDFFHSFPEYHTVILFGSIAKGDTHQESDIDLAVSKSSKMNWEEQSMIRSQLEILLKRNIDLVDLCGLEGLILGEILIQGISIKIDMEYFLSKLLNYRNYMDLYYIPYLSKDRKEHVSNYFQI